MAFVKSRPFLFFVLLAVFKQSYTKSIGDVDLQLGGRIAGGKPIDITEAPYQVEITYNGGHWCGGSIIGEKWVLTAAHCLLQSISKYAVLVGSSEINMGTPMPIAKVVIHEKFNSLAKLNYDYALIELVDKLKFGDTQRPIELPDKTVNIKDGSLCLVTGFGDKLNTSNHRDLLHAVSVPIVNQLKCEKIYATLNLMVTDAMICAGFGRGACKGDSGGPLVYNNTLIGVVSWGQKCADPNYPGVYARVSTVRQWIRNHSGI